MDPLRNYREVSAPKYGHGTPFLVNSQDYEFVHDSATLVRKRSNSNWCSYRHTDIAKVSVGKLVPWTPPPPGKEGICLQHYFFTTYFQYLQNFEDD